ncbi:MAG TPA: hypothetical protein DDZ70_03865, partial [Firmicutes bacterium]|nr:hypothetical protein [Bacillota bacterium]
MNGGWPTNAFLSPDGEVLLSGTYIPPAQMKLYIKTVLKSWHGREERAKIQSRLAEEAERVRQAERK